MLNEFLSPGFFPFSLALGLFFGLFLLEVVFALLGGTILGAGGEVDGPDLDLDLDAPDLGDFEVDLDGLDLEAADLELPDLDMPEGDAPEAGGIAAWLGFGKMPALIWLACVLIVFGWIGLSVQLLTREIMGFVLPASIAAIPAIVGALWFAKKFGALFARLLPKIETQSLSERHLGRRMGVVSQGTAARGRPAEVRVTDHYGNTHYLRAEPLRDEVSIPQGAQVLVLRHKQEGGYLLVPMSAKG